jgi:cation:H+ antiporter
MFNMFILCVVGLAFGGKQFLQKIAPQQGYLIVVAVFITGLAVLFSGLKLGVDALGIGLSSVVLIIVFLAGMWWVYVTRPPEDRPDDADDLAAVGMTLRKAWIMFLAVSAGVVVSGFFLAWSTDEIADITGIASSTLGILLMALVTSMPEVATAIAAARMGAMDLGVAGLYGSCAFNVTILFYADIFYRDGILVNQAEPAHFVAGGVAIALMLVGLVLILSRDRIKSAVAVVVLAMMAIAYIAGAAVVATLGATEEDDSGKAGSSGQASRTPDE